MDAAIVTRSKRIGTSRAFSIDSIRIPAAMLLVGLLALASAVLLIRRIAGALSEPLPASLLMAVGLAAAGAAIASIAMHASPATKWSAGLSLPLLGLSISLPGSSPIGLAALWLAIGAAEVGIWRFDRLIGARTSERIARPPINTIATTETQTEEVDQPTQKLTYVRTTDSARIEGWLRVPIEAGQRTLIAHVAFCPAFHRVPQVEVEPVDGPDCTIRATTIFPWGVRFEIKLDEPSDVASDATMEFVAFEN
jgi:hypothetical protein